MSDQNTSLPVRTESNGDVVAKIVDGTITSQALAIDAAGKIEVKLDDAAGTGITSQASGAQQALDVGINVAGVQVDPRDIRALTSADVVTADQGTANTVANGWPVKLTDGTNTAAVSASGELSVQVTQPLPAGTNIIGDVGVTNLPTTVDTDYGAVGASTIRTAAEIGNATGAADFDNGATGAQTLRVAANLAVGGANVTNANPVPVILASATPAGDHINDFKDASAVAAAASDDHDYTVTAGKTLSLSQVIASGSGKAKLEVKVETGVATGTFLTKCVLFNSTATPNMEWILVEPISVAAGVRVRATMTNRDNQAQDLYSTISGTEI